MHRRALLLMLVVSPVAACGGDQTAAPVNEATPAAYQICGTVGSVPPPRSDGIDPITALAVSRDGKRVAAGRWSDLPSALAMTWVVGSGDAPMAFPAGSLAGTSLEFSPDGLRLAAAGDERSVFDLATRRAIFSILPAPYVPPEGGQNLLRFSPDGRELASGDAEKTITRFADDGTVLSRWPSARAVGGVAYSPDGKLLASHVPEVWRLSDGHQLWAADPTPAPAQLTGFRENWAEFSPDGSALLVSTCATESHVVADCRGPARLFRASDGTWLADLGTMSRRPTFSPDGRRLLSGSQVMDIATRATVQLPVDASLAVYLRDGRIAAAERSGVVRLVCPAK